MHSLLLNSQSLTVERPARGTGLAVGAALTGVAGALALALLLRALNWPHSFPQFLAYSGAGLLLVVALVFAFWTYACAAMRYDVEQAALVIRWGPIAHRVPASQVHTVVRGRGEDDPKVSGIDWLGYHVGRGVVREHEDVLFYSTHRVPEDIVYVVTDSVAYALSPRDPGRFMTALEAARRAPDSGHPPHVERELLAAHPILADRIAQYLVLAAIAINVALWGFVLAEYPHLASQIKIEFPPVGSITTLQSRGKIFDIPATASAMLGANFLVAMIFQPRERAATYLVLSGTVFFQVVFWLAAIVAVSNA